MRTRHVIRHPGQALSRKCGLNNEFAGVKSQTAGHLYVHSLGPALELPGHQPAVGGQTQTNTVVIVQIIWLLWWRVAFKVTFAADNSQLHVGRHANGNHVFGYVSAKPYSYVVAICNDVGKAVVTADLEFDVGVIGQPRQQSRPDQ